eukprot:CCRYP_008875-RB/>CCRYP_008875-RB protein AED:0.06 eAED:0.06 QI:177/1/1/1/1/1/3/340/316
MSDLPLSFVHNRHVVAQATGEVGVLLPSSPVREPIAALLTLEPYLLSAVASTALHHHQFHRQDHATHSPTHNEDRPTAPLRFIFSGYSLWLELKQFNISTDGRGDLSRMVDDAAIKFQTVPIPMPHVTALYGIELEEEDVRRIFREDVRRVLEEKSSERRKKSGFDDSGSRKALWPDLEALGILVDVEYNGVNRGTMDMAWAEVTFATSQEHEALIDALYGLFCSRPIHSSPATPRSIPWVPHLSLCYDNPEGFGPNLSRGAVQKFISEKCPTLKSAIHNNSSCEEVKFSRSVSGISLWQTAGTIDQWKFLDRIDF